ncbi:hypothetical protein [Conexibacter arvalis]|uniref:Uncharacterized protein n=1 Tax=Conexibacter arvalis TaxID=912552 RepID=A0A840IG15_9ACTN|nr:hypothetical protein [Conexibacter arvalis]MBB4662880.1 hypothetical protein [Conexibacter arvalis]
MPATDQTVWKVATIAFLARQTITVLDGLPAGVREIDADTLDEPVEVDPARLHDLADRLVDLTGQIEMTASALPGRRLMIDRARLCSAADLALRQGIAVPEQALFAARLLPYRDAYRAIAHALRTSDARRSWDDLTVTDLLSNPAGATVELGRIVAALAGLDPTTELSRCSDAQTSALAEAIEATADRDRR